MRAKNKNTDKHKIDNETTGVDQIPSLGNSPNGNPNQVVQWDTDELAIQLAGSAGKLQRPVIYGLFDRASRRCIKICILPPRERRISGIVEKHFARIQHEQVLTTMPSVEAGVWEGAKE